MWLLHKLDTSAVHSMIAFPNSYFAQRELVVLTVGGYDSVTMLIRALKMKKLISDYL